MSNVDALILEDSRKFVQQYEQSKRMYSTQKQMRYYLSKTIVRLTERIAELELKEQEA